MEARHDPILRRFSPDPELVAHAHNRMLDGQRHEEAFIRQRWEETLGAVRVALTTLREIYPSDAPYHFSLAERVDLEGAVHALETAHVKLNAMEGMMLGDPMVMVLHGHVTTVEQYKELFEGDAA